MYHNFKACQMYIKKPPLSCSLKMASHKLKLCSFCVLLIKYILPHKVVLDFKFKYILLIFENTTGMPHLNTVSAGQGHVHKYEEVKRKTYKCNANTFFNQKYLREI